MKQEYFSRISANFADSIQELLIENNLTVASFSQLTGIDSAAIYRWLAKERLPTTTSVIKIANLFNCSVDFLLGLSSEKSYPISSNNDCFYIRLTKLKNAKGIGYENFGRLTGISSENQTRWKKGFIPNIENLVIISEFFECSTDFLLGRTD